MKFEIFRDRRELASAQTSVERDNVTPHDHKEPRSMNNLVLTFDI